MEPKQESANEQRDAAGDKNQSDEARPGRPSHHVGRRRFLAAGLATGPVLFTLGTTHAVDAAPGNPCQSNSLSRLASFHPGTRTCPNTMGGGGR